MTTRRARRTANLKREIADLEDQVAELEQQVGELERNLDGRIARAKMHEGPGGTFGQAAHSLHEQAHGETPWRTCQQYPCRELDLAVAASHGHAPPFVSHTGFPGAPDFRLWLHQ